MINDIYKIIKELEKYKDTKDDIDILNDIDIISGMINGTIAFDDNKVNDIKNKYIEELVILYNMEQRLRSFQANENTSSNKSLRQYLLNIRHSLVRVQIRRIMKRKGKSMLEDDLINYDNNYLYNKFIEVMESKS